MSSRINSLGLIECTQHSLIELIWSSSSWNLEQAWITRMHRVINHWSSYEICLTYWLVEVLTKDTEGISWVVQMKQFLYICEMKLIIEFPDKILKVFKVLSVFGFVRVKKIWEGSGVEFVWYISIKPSPKHVPKWGRREKRVGG